MDWVKTPWAKRRWTKIGSTPTHRLCDRKSGRYPELEKYRLADQHNVCGSDLKTKKIAMKNHFFNLLQKIVKELMQIFIQVARLKSCQK